MSWGERSCLKPCRCPDRAKYETCNVDCPSYVWDGVTKTDSISEKALERKLRGSTVGLTMAALGVDIMGAFPKRKVIDIDGIDIEKEYELIQQKKSTLPSTKRKYIVRLYERGRHE
jgi:hypothetical protein